MANQAEDLEMSPPRFAPGDKVRVRIAYPIGHCRTPFYFRGTEGEIERHCGAFANPEELAYGRSGKPHIHLYRVRAKQIDLWDDYQGSAADTIEVEIFEHWLEPATAVQNR
ncbi:MAG: SH3-like domain-containing protein [Pseudomonadota bacterium]